MLTKHFRWRAIYSMMCIAIPGCACAEISAQDLSSIIDEQSQYVASFITASLGKRLPNKIALVKNDGGAIRSSFGGKIEVNLNIVAKDFQNIPMEVLPYVARWVIAHEYWHQVQYAEIGRNALILSNDDARLRECEADLMGAYIVASDQKAIKTSPEILDYLVELPNYIDPAGEAGLHPEPDQRELAIIFGIFRQQFDTAGSLGGVFSQDTKEVINSIVDERSGETIDDWHGRICAKLVHYKQDAARAIMLVSESTHDVAVEGFDTLHRPIAIPGKQVELVYKNVGDESIKVALSLLAGTSDQLITGKGKYFFPYMADNFERELNPGENMEMSVAYPRVLPNGRKLHLIYEPGAIPISAEIIKGTFSDPFAITGLGTREPVGDEKYFLNSVELFSQSAKTGFRNYAVCESVGVGATLCDSRLQFFGAKETLINVENGAGEVEVTLFEGNRKEDAGAVLQRYAKWLNDLWPSEHFEVAQDGEDIGGQLMVARKLRVSLNMSRIKDNGKYEVTLDLTAVPY